MFVYVYIHRAKKHFGKFIFSNQYDRHEIQSTAFINYIYDFRHFKLEHNISAINSCF